MISLSALRPVLTDLAVLDDGTPRSSAAGVEADSVIGGEVGLGIRPPSLRIWENPRALVVTARESRLPAFDSACRALAADGWPVVLRDSGGTAVPHGPGILEVSLALPLDRLPPHALEAIYGALCEPVRIALAELGVETAYGEVEGSFCDGRFNLVAGGRKIAGTSQRWRGGLPPSHRPDGYVLAHMVLFVDADMRAATEVVNRFYGLAGSDHRFDPGAVVSAVERLGLPRAESGDLTIRVREGIAKAAQRLASASTA
jgi:lipoate-protein ligase A